MADVTVQQKPETASQVDTAQMSYAMDQLRSQQNLIAGSLAGLGASLVGAGLWAVVTPQARVGGGAAVPDVLRFGVGGVFLPRTHFNLNLHYYRDRNRTSEITTQILLLQLHLYL